MPLLAHLLLSCAALVPIQRTAEAWPDAAFFDAYPKLARLQRSVALEFNGASWRFTASPAGRGLRLERTLDGNLTVADLDFNGELGPVVHVTATVSQVPGGTGFVAVAIASLSDAGDQIEYRMMEGASFESEKLMTPAGWHRTTTLITAPADSPFPAMGVHLVGGDSMLLTLQRANRVSGGVLGELNRFETHRFIHHCPMAGPLLEHSIATHDVQLFDRKGNVVTLPEDPREPG